MINLMYLVLTAMLALNVSAEVMNAFFTLDKGNKASIATVDSQLDQTVDGLKELLDRYKVRFATLDRKLTNSFESIISQYSETVRRVEDDEAKVKRERQHAA